MKLIGICSLTIFFISGSIAAVNKLPLDYGPPFNDTLLPLGDYMKVPLTLSNPQLHFIDHTYDTVFIDVDGAIWLGEAHCDEDCPIPMKFPYQPGKQMVACYWADADSTLNPNSAVWYRNSKDEYTWSKVNSYLQNALGTKPQFDYTSPNKILIVATWIDTTYAGGDATTPTNSFQCALASDGVNSYAIFSFGSLGWGSSPGQTLPAVVGVDDGTSQSSQSSLVLPYSWTTEVTSLATYTNFKTKSSDGGPYGWSFVSKCSPIIPPVYPIPPNTPTKHCYANGDPHYYTFDGLSLDGSFGGRPQGDPYGYPTSNQPTGHYVLMATTNCKDTQWPPVSVVAEVEPITANAPPDPRPVAGVHGVIVTFYWNSASIGTKSEIVVEMRDNQLMVGTTLYTSYDCPEKLCQNYGFSVNPFNGGFKLTTTFGITVSYANWQVDIYLAYLPDLQGAIFGYCGNMNGVANDDNYCWDPTQQNFMNYQYCWPESYLAGHVSDWGPGWFDCPYTFDKLLVHQNLLKHLSKSNHQNKRNLRYDILSCAEQKCFALTDPNGVFQACQTTSTIQNLYASCVADLSVMNCDEDMLCNYAQQTARDCMSETNMTSLKWRSPDFCPLLCPQNSHYSDGFPPCVATCDDPFAPDFCTDQNTEGCQCDNGTLYQNGVCIQPSQCAGCLDDQGNTVPIGATWYTLDCSNQCTCSNAGVTCKSHPCDTNAVCNVTGSYATCACTQGYYGDGFYCSTINNCPAINDCQNGGFCVNQATGYTCSCTDYFTGDHCQTQIDFCTPNPCINGDCALTNTGPGYVCNCIDGFTGSTCNLEVNWCASFPCVNQGTCTSTNDGYSCACPSGYYGNNCESNTSVTTSAAQATTPLATQTTSPSFAPPATTSQSSPPPLLSTIWTSVQTWFTSSATETTTQSQHPCLGFDCLNNGTCRLDDGTPFCECTTGYGGLHCEHKVNYCSPDPCIHGDCVDEETSYYCNCCEGYTGANCDQVDHCSPNPCQNSGTCTNSAEGYNCICPAGYTGINCEQQKSTSSIPSTLSTPDPSSFNCTGRHDGNYPLSTTQCLATYIVCVNGQSFVEHCVHKDADFDPVSYLCAYKCFIKACIDDSCHPKFLFI